MNVGQSITENNVGVAPITAGDADDGRVRVLGLGGTTRAGSSTERALAAALRAAGRAGASTTMLSAADLDLPLYAPEVPDRDPKAIALLDLVQRADGIMIATPGYHGGISGLVKNALDYLEDLRLAPRPYLEGRAVGCIVCAYGWQATVTTLQSLRTTVHALRAWPTPLGVALNSAEQLFTPDGLVADPVIEERFTMLAEQVVGFAQARAAGQ